MSKKLSLQREMLDKIGIQIRKNVLPGLNNSIHNRVDEMIEYIELPL